MADEQIAVEADEETHVEDVAEQQDDTPEPIANLATELGWTPKDQWSGDPDKWKPAEQFIRDGRDIQQTTARELKGLREQMDRIGGVTETIVRDKVAERDAYWQQQFGQAVEDGDTAKALELSGKRPTAQPQQAAPPPEVAAWVAKNPWFNTDPLAQSRAQEISERLKHLPVADQLAQVDRAMRKEFPENYAAPAKTPPATQTGQSRNPSPSNRQKGFADMPDFARAAALDLEERLQVKKEDYAKSYWAKNEGVKR